jgi:hypothetical protein
MGIDPMNNISIIIRILFAITLFQQPSYSEHDPKHMIVMLETHGTSGTVTLKK